MRLASSNLLQAIRIRSLVPSFRDTVMIFFIFFATSHTVSIVLEKCIHDYFD